MPYDPVMQEALKEALLGHEIEITNHVLTDNCGEYRIWFKPPDCREILVSVAVMGSKIEIGYGGAGLKDLQYLDLADPDSLSQLPRLLLTAYEAAKKKWANWGHLGAPRQDIHAVGM